MVIVHPVPTWPDRARVRRAARRPQLDVRGRGALVERPGADRVRDPAQQRVGLRRSHGRRRRSTARRSRRWASRRCRSWCSADSRCCGRSCLGAAARPRWAATSCSTRRCCAIAQLRAGLSTLLGQQLVLMGTFFVIPVYLQVVLGLDAFETGKRLLPLSVAMLMFALLGPRIAGRRSPRTVAQAGLVAVSIGALVMLATLDVELNDTGFKVALALIGAGAGPARLAAGQRDHVLCRAREDQRGGRPSGHRAEPRAPRSAQRSSARCCSRRSRRASASASPTTPPSRRRRARRSSRTLSRGSTSCPSRTSRRLR